MSAVHYLWSSPTSRSGHGIVPVHSPNIIHIEHYHIEQIYLVMRMFQFFVCALL